MKRFIHFANDEKFIDKAYDENFGKFCLLFKFGHDILELDRNIYGPLAQVARAHP